jgi:hypothetical protein
MCSGELPWLSEQGKRKKDLTSGPPPKYTKKTLIVWFVYFYLDFMHVVPRQSDSGVYLSKIVLVGFISIIGAH